MCSSMLLVVQSTIVTASIVRGSAPKPTTISLPRLWARAGAGQRSARAIATGSSAVRRRIRISSRGSGSVELVQGEPEARDERLQEVADLREIESLDARPQALLGLGELRVAGSRLLETLEVGADLVSRVQQHAVRVVAGARPEERLVGRLQRVGDQPEELLLRGRLDR